jgi:hypothetical protein
MEKKKLKKLVLKKEVIASLDGQELSLIKGGVTENATDIISLFLPAGATPAASTAITFAVSCAVCASAIIGTYEGTRGIYEVTQNTLNKAKDAYNKYDSPEYWMRKITNTYNGRW